MSAVESDLAVVAVAVGNGFIVGLVWCRITCRCSFRRSVVSGGVSFSCCRACGTVWYHTESYVAEAARQATFDFGDKNRQMQSSDVVS